MNSVSRMTYLMIGGRGNHTIYIYIYNVEKEWPVSWLIFDTRQVDACLRDSCTINKINKHNVYDQVIN